MNIKENIKSIIKNTYNIIYKVFIEKKDERKLQKFIDENVVKIMKLYIM